MVSLTSSTRWPYGVWSVVVGSVVVGEAITFSFLVEHVRSQPSCPILMTLRPSMPLGLRRAAWRSDSPQRLSADRHRSSLYHAPTMRRLSTVESLLGAAAAIRVACASSGSASGGTTSKAILLRLSPRTSTVWTG